MDGELLNFNMLYDMSVCDDVEEALVLIAEAVNLWSPERLVLQNCEVMAFFSELFSNIAMYDESLAIYFEALVRKGSGPWLVAAPDAVATAAACIEEDTAALMGLLEGHVVEETPLKDFVGKVTKCVSGLREPCKASVLADEAYKRVTMQVAQSIEIRTTMFAFLRTIGNLGAFPATPEEAFADWRNKRSAGKLVDSVFSRLIAVHSAAQALDSVSYDFSGQKASDSFAIAFDEGEGLDNLIGVWSSAIGLPSKLRASPLVLRVSEFMRGSMQVLVDELSGFLPQGAVMFPPGQPVQENICKFIGGFFILSQMNDSIKQAARVFSARQDLAWPVADMLALIEDVNEVVPDVLARVSLASFVRALLGQAVVAWASAADVISMLRLLCSMCHVSTTFAFLESKYATEADAIKDFGLKPEVESAVSFARAHLASLNEGLQTGAYGDMSRFASVPWPFPLAQASDWAALACKCVPFLCKLGYLRKSRISMSGTSTCWPTYSC